MSEDEEKKKASIKFSSRLLELLSKLGEMELEDVDLEVGDLEIWLQPTARAAVPSKVSVPPKAKPMEILEADFVPPVWSYPGRIVEVRLGAMKDEGGTRGKSLTIGGEAAPAYYLFEKPTPHLPVIAYDVFDAKVPLAKAVKMHVQDVMDDPAAWAKLAVDKFDADMVTLHLISTDPLIQNASPREAAKKVEEVLQAVDVPLAVGGSGDPQKDVEVFERVAEVAEGERLLINSVRLEMDIERIAKVIEKHGHVALAFTSMDMNQARELNRRLYDFLPKEQIVIDTTTAALGYGLDYAFSIMERVRLAGLMGDPQLQHPMASGTTNAWAAREAWMQMAPEWGPRELRGPMWETVTALTLLLTGVDLFMMMHPAAVKTVKDVIKELASTGRAKPESIANWVSVKI
jgi:acetyl-CoA decarbonylase/synthase complex subunit delta